MSEHRQDPFEPAWAKDALTKPTATDLAELALLREFYDLWEQFHALSKDKMGATKGERLGKELMEKVAVLRRFRNPSAMDFKGTLHMPKVQQ